MTYEHLYGLSPLHEEVPYRRRFLSREEDFQKIARQPLFDVVIVGGGIHGASMARLSAFNGLKTLLVEKGDYASQTSSRSSKMAHGGLRYLEMLDFQQVMEGIRAREDLFEVAPHLVRPQHFLLPQRGSSFFQYAKLKLGLSFYDLFLRKKELHHHYLSPDMIPSGSVFFQDSRYSGYFQFTDGIMEDTRLVLEHILSARQEGATCLNYCRFNSAKHEEDETVSFGITDTLTGQFYTGRTGIVVNCAGPWAPTIGRIGKSQDLKVRYSQGAHLLFSFPWNGPALMLPMSEKGRYYFVWPHAAGTLVGTTEREVYELSEDPSSAPEEIEEILQRLKHDLPHLPFSRETLHYTYAGIRTLPMTSSSSATSKISRRHQWMYSQGMLTLLGGKYTTASWTVYEGLKRIWKLANLTRPLYHLRGRKLPGGFITPSAWEEFQKRCTSHQVSSEIQEGVYRRLGSRVQHFDDEEDFSVVGNYTLRGEISFAIEVEQAHTLEDVIRRRILLEYHPSITIQQIEEIAAVAQDINPKGHYSNEIGAYIKRLTDLKNLMMNS